MINADADDLVGRLREYSGQLSCRREVLAKLAEVGDDLVAKVKEGAVSSLAEVLDRRESVLRRLEQVLSQTRDVEHFVAEASRLTNHSTAEVAATAKALARSADEMTAIIESILRTQRESEDVLKASLQTVQGERQEAARAKRLAATYRGRTSNNPRFLDSKR